MKDDGDGAFGTLVEQFRAVLAAPGMPSTDQELPPAAVGEKRNRRAEEDQPRKKRVRGPSEWMILYTTDRTKKQRYLYSITDDRVQHYVNKGLSDNLYISSVGSSCNLWGLILEARTGFTDQIYLIARYFLNKEWIVGNWDLGYYITAVAGNDRGCSLTVMSKGTNYLQQSYKVCRTVPLSWIKKKWREGFFVTSIGTTATHWAVVVSRTMIYKDQVVELNSNFSSERLRRLREDRGLYVTAVGASQQHAVVVFSVPAEARAVHQEVVCSPNFPSSDVKSHWSKDSYISSMACGRTNSFANKALKVVRHVVKLS